MRIEINEIEYLNHVDNLDVYKNVLLICPLNRHEYRRMEWHNVFILLNPPLNSNNKMCKKNLFSIIFYVKQRLSRFNIKSFSGCFFFSFILCNKCVHVLLHFPVYWIGRSLLVFFYCLLIRLSNKCFAV